MVFVRHAGSVAVVVIAAAVSVGGCADSSSTPSSTTSSTPSAAGVSTPPSASTVTVNGAATVPPGAPNPNAPEQVTPGDIPDNQVFVPYAPPGAVFEVSVPQGWARTADGAATVFTDKFNAVRIDARPRPVAPDVASVRAQEVPALATAPAFSLGEVTVVDRKAGKAVLVTYTAGSPIDPVTGKSVLTAVERYAFWRAGQEVVLTLSSAKGADNVDPWRTVTDSLRWRV